MAPPKKRFVLSISSWFCLPEQGMKDFEILCRGSAFLIPSKSLTFPNRMHVVTASHVVAPWRWPKYFNAEWLQAVNEKNMHYTVELRHDDGSLLVQQELLPQSYHHISRDLAILHIEHSKDNTGMDPETGILDTFALEALELYSEATPAAVGTRLSCHGHEVVNPDIGFSDTTVEDADDNRKPEPRIVSGSIFRRSQHQVFASMSYPLTDGMCGGPVVEDDNGTAIGVLEGIVPLDHVSDELRGAAVFIESDVISKFVEDIEDKGEQANAHFLKGEAWLHVGSDQDPEKMDMRRFGL
eukprot:gene350-628_t